MFTRKFRIQKSNFVRLAGAAVAVGLAMTALTARAGLFTGPFAPANWNFSGDTGAELIWSPTIANPDCARVYAAPGLNGTITTFALVPTLGSYQVTFTTTFNAMSATAASLTMNAPGYAGVSLGSYPGGPQTEINTFTVTLGPTDTISFAMTADSPSDKKNVPFFTVDGWDVQVIPEASTCIAALGLLSLCGVQIWRARQNPGSSAQAA